MRSLELNLASRPFRNNSLLWLGYLVLAVAVVSFTAWNTVTFVDTGRKLDQLRNTVGSVESRLNDVDQRERSAEGRIGKHDVRYLTTQTMRANEVIHRKAFSWTGLFNVLEDVQPYEVKMTSIRPLFGTDPTGISLASSAGPEVVPVSVDGVAKTVQAFFDFEDALIRDPHIDRIEPTRSNRAKNGEILFALSFLYYPEGLEKKASPAEGSAARAAVAVEEEEARDASAEPGAGDAGKTGADAASDVKAPSAQPPAANPAAAQLPTAAVPAPARPVPIATSRTSPSAQQPERAYTPPPEAGTDGDPARRPLFKVGERHTLPEGPIRPKPKDYQPPDPFKDRKKKSAAPEKTEGDR